jgi:hypothetical protein
LWGSPASRTTQKLQARYHGETRSSRVVPHRRPSLKEECDLMHPLQGASFLSTPLQGGILKPPALRVVDDWPYGVHRTPKAWWLIAVDPHRGGSLSLRPAIAPQPPTQARLSHAILRPSAAMARHSVLPRRAIAAQHGHILRRERRAKITPLTLTTYDLEQGASFSKDVLGMAAVGRGVVPTAPSAMATCVGPSGPARSAMTQTWERTGPSAALCTTAASSWTMCS